MSEEKQKRRATAQRPAQLANAEIDSRLAQAIRDRAKAITQVSKLVHWQDRLARLEQEINSLIGFQQRLSGQGQSVSLEQSLEAIQRLRTGTEAPLVMPPATSFSHLNPIPDGVTSIPTKTANPKPSGGNVGDLVGGEGGFS